jgi:serine/threonine protein phosphatase 1
MIASLRNLFRASERAFPASVPAGTRAYAVGDIHGRADLFAALIAAIDADDAARAKAETSVVLLGDLIDRGPDSAEVLRLARLWQAARRVRILLGNHEELLLDALEDREVLREFLRWGGRETAFSFGIDPAAYALAGLDEVQAMLRASIPATELAFIRSFEDRVRIGDYLFVHAGIRPEVPLDEQRPSDLRWIRGTFLDHSGDHGFTVVHGHTIADEVEVRANRIGIDTGAYASGRLSALGLEGSQRWLIETEQLGARVTISKRSI